MIVVIAITIANLKFNFSFKQVVIIKIEMFMMIPNCFPILKTLAFREFILSYQDRMSLEVVQNLIHSFSVINSEFHFLIHPYQISVLLLHPALNLISQYFYFINFIILIWIFLKFAILIYY